MAIDENKLAEAVAYIEGGEVNQTIAQVKETLRCLLDIFGSGITSWADVVGTIEKHEGNLYADCNVTAIEGIRKILDIFPEK